MSSILDLLISFLSSSPVLAISPHTSDHTLEQSITSKCNRHFLVTLSTIITALNHVLAYGEALCHSNTECIRSPPPVLSKAQLYPSSPFLISVKNLVTIDRERTCPYHRTRKHITSAPKSSCLKWLSPIWVDSHVLYKPSINYYGLHEPASTIEWHDLTPSSNRWDEGRQAISIIFAAPVYDFTFPFWSMHLNGIFYTYFYLFPPIYLSA